MTRAVVVARIGGPEVLEVRELELGSPGPGEARVRHGAIGLNYIDVYFRSGVYPPPGLPFVPGLEGAGTVEEVGPGVVSLAPGDRVAYASRPLGAYAEARNLPADRLVALPDEVDFETAAAIVLKGLTAQVLVRRVVPLAAGDWVLVHAAAGGVGSLLASWAASLGARVIGTVGSPEKARLAKRRGAEHTVLYRDEPLARRVREITSGQGVRVVYDSVGRDTLRDSLDCLAPLGTLVSFGQSSGSPPPVELSDLASRGSLFLTRPSLLDYTARREDLLASAKELFAALRSGAVEATIGARFPLAEAARAHRALEGRQTTGSTLLMP